MQSCLLVPHTIALCIILIFLLYPELIESFVVGDGESKPWHTPGGARYFMKGGAIMPHHQDVIDHRGHSNDTMFVSDVLSGDGAIPIIGEDNVDNEYKGFSHHMKKEGFWYDINRLEDEKWKAGTLDAEFKNMLDGENKMRNDLIAANVKKKEWKVGATPVGFGEKINSRLVEWDAGTPPLIEGFGNNRAPENWNVGDYPIKTTNNLDMTESFPQSAEIVEGMYKNDNIRKLWGDFDMLRSDDVYYQINRYGDETVPHELTSRTIASHAEKK